VLLWVNGRTYAIQRPRLLLLWQQEEPTSHILRSQKERLALLAAVLVVGSMKLRYKILQPLHTTEQVYVRQS
jgi:hypothetical protein